MSPILPRSRSGLSENQQTGLSRRVLPALVAVALALLAACSEPQAGPSPDSDAPVRGGTLVVAEDGSWPTLDPHLTNTNTGPYQHMYETLFHYSVADPSTGKHELTGRLAESWDTSDPLVLTIKLRQGVKFHDGSDWNAEVAKWNLDRIKASPEALAYNSLASIEAVEVVDASTLRLKLAEPNPALLISLSDGSGVGTSMISKQAFETGSGDARFAGTGPFKVESFVLDDRTTLTRFDGYWRKDANGDQLPYLDKIVFRVLQDKAVAVTELRAGTVHAVRNLPATDLQALTADPTVRYVPYIGNQLQRGYTGFNTRKAPFDDVRVRQAAMFASNREALAQTLGFQATQQQVPMFSSAMLGWDEALNHMYDYNLDEAKRLLSEAGHSGGVNATLIFQARQPDQRIGEVLQQMWGQAGINLQLQPLEEATWVERMKSGDFDVSLWAGNTYPDPALGAPAFICGAAFNWSNYCSSEVERLLNEGQSTFDESERSAAYKVALEIVMADAAVAPMYAEVRHHVESAAVRNSSRNWFFWDFSEAWLVE